MYLRANGVAGKLSADLAIGASSMSSGGLADLPAVASPDIAKVTLFQTDANGRVTKQEIVHVTAHTASATSATIVKGKESTSDQAWNGSSAPDSWVHAPTGDDWMPRASTVKNTGGPTFSGTPFAWKGSGFTPVSAFDIVALGASLTLVNGGVYQAAIAEGGATITKITKTASFTAPAAGNAWIWMDFAAPVRLVASTLYTLIVGRTDSTDTYALPVNVPANPLPTEPLAMPGIQNAVASPRVAKANPAVGDTIDLTGSTLFTLGVRWAETT